MNQIKKQNIKEYDDEEVRSIFEEITWRDKEIDRLTSILSKYRERNILNKTPKQYATLIFWCALFLIVSFLPAFNYGRNLWQTFAYYLNQFLWSIKDWWY